MSSYNRVILVGNLTRDPQLSYTPANTPVCKFGLATNRSFKDREGNSRDEVCYVDCTLFGRGGEVFNQYMTKGRSALVEGRLHFHQWTTPEGDKRSKLDVVVESFTFLGGGQRSGGEAGGGYGGAAESGSGQRGATESGGGYRGATEGGGGYRGATEGGAAPVSSGGTGAGYDEPPPPTDDDIPF